MSVIRGKDFMLYIDLSDNIAGGVTGLPVCYAQDVAIKIVADMNEATVPPEGGFRNFFPGLKQYSLSFNGVAVELDGMVTTITDLQNYIIQDQPLYWKCVNKANPKILYSGKAYLTSVDETSPYDTPNMFNAEAQGDGVLKISDINPVNASNIYYGVQDTSAQPSDFSRFIFGDPSKDISIPYGVVNTPGFFWMAYNNQAAQKNKFKDNNDTNNAGNIGGATDLFLNHFINIGGEQYTYVMTQYKTLFTGPSQSVTFYLNQAAPQSCAKVTNLHIGSIFPGDMPVTVVVITFQFTDNDYLNALGYAYRLINLDTNEIEVVDFPKQGSATIGGPIGGKPNTNYSLEILRKCSLTDTSGWQGPVLFKTPTY